MFVVLFHTWKVGGVTTGSSYFEGMEEEEEVKTGSSSIVGVTPTKT